MFVQSFKVLGQEDPEIFDRKPPDRQTLLGKKAKNYIPHIYYVYREYMALFKRPRRFNVYVIRVICVNQVDCTLQASVNMCIDFVEIYSALFDFVCFSCIVIKSQW